MKARELIGALEEFAPPVYQESYDNSGLQCGDPDTEIKGALFCLDFTDAVLEEAIALNCNIIVGHHPLLFGTLKSVTPSNPVGRLLTMAIRNGLVLYAIHTNLDNMRQGVNHILAEKLGLEKTSILKMSRGTLRQLYTYAPKQDAEKVRKAMFDAGAGSVGKYDECSYNIEGQGTFRPCKGADPYIGEEGKRELVDEVRIEVLVEQHQEARILKALFRSHPYEEVAYGFVHLHNANQQMGAGMVGSLKEPLPLPQFLAHVQRATAAGVLRYAGSAERDISKVAICGGSGSFLIREAIGAGADAFITGDLKYHQFFEAEDKIVLIDAGHFETEQFVPELLIDYLRKKFPTFALHLTRVNTNPVRYFTQ